MTERRPRWWLLALGCILAFLFSGAAIISLVPMMTCGICHGKVVWTPSKPIPCEECGGRGKVTLFRKYTGWSDDFDWIRDTGVGSPCPRPK
jgi:DnaJ-class molecular chaperone